jgi:hypothetical protein
MIINQKSKTLMKNLKQNKNKTFKIFKGLN